MFTSILYNTIWKQKPRHEPYVYNSVDHTTWGDSIVVDDWAKGKIYGWLWRKPQVGDLIRFAMNNGSTIETKVVKVKYTHDPPDMFFATVKKLGTVE